MKFYTVPVPTYVGGCMTLSFASDVDYYCSFDLDLAKKVELSAKYYTTELQIASFALPKYIKEILLGDNN